MGGTRREPQDSDRLDSEDLKGRLDHHSVGILQMERLWVNDL